MSEVSAGGQTKSNKKLIWVFVVIILLLLTAIASLIFAFVHAQKEDNVTGVGSVRGVVTNEQEAHDMVESMLNDTVPQGYFLTSVTNDWVFPNGTSASPNAYVGNDQSNTQPMCFDLNLKDTGELIYSSPVVPVGTYVNNIVLDKNLPAGDYECVLTHRFLDNDYLETGATLKLTISLTVNQ